MCSVYAMLVAYHLLNMPHPPLSLEGVLPGLDLSGQGICHPEVTHVQLSLVFWWGAWKVKGPVVAKEGWLLW